MGLCLVFAGEIQVNIRHLVSAEAKEGLKGDIKTILFQSCTAARAVHIRKICTTVKLLGHIQNGMLALRIGATVVGWEGIERGEEPEDTEMGDRKAKMP